MSKSARKIGEVHPRKPFPIAIMQLRPTNFGEPPPPCRLQDCRTQSGPAIFLSRPFLRSEDIRAATLQFTRDEAYALLWQKAYQEQRRGAVVPNVSHAICAPCTLHLIAGFMGDEQEWQEQSMRAIRRALALGTDIMLFDRNLARGITYPSLMLGTFQTLEAFREAYYSQETP